MAGRNSHLSNASIFFSLFIVSVVVFLWPKSDTAKISMLFQATFQRFLAIGRDAGTPSDRLRPDSKDTFSRSEYTQLWKDYKNVYAQLMAVHDENERLAKLRTGLPQLSAEGLVPAQITGTVGNYSHEVIIDKGSIASIRPGQYVLSEQHDSVVGVVSDVSEAAAKIRLLTDTRQTLEIHIRRDGTDKNIDAMMVGNGDGTCSIPLIEIHQKVLEGDTVYAAAVPGILPAPLVVGEITDVRTDDKEPLLLKITVRLAEDMTRLDHVSVIVVNKTLLIKG
ncbi:MAG: rod shape-determining protein MreC [Phycisphaerae bacterium]|nr:rod shape-determining protein MreC [Phycisphaerae bacterium]